MAKRPTTLPRWATKSYGPDDLAWQEAVRQCRRALFTWAREKRYGFYSDLVPLVPAIAWPEGPHTHEGQQMGYLLGHVSIEELDTQEDRPLLSALVVARDDNLPSTGFWKFAEEMGVRVGSSTNERLAFWVQEIQRCFRTYG